MIKNVKGTYSLFKFNEICGKKLHFVTQKIDRAIFIFLTRHEQYVLIC
jgi:hypothetical protein